MKLEKILSVTSKHSQGEWKFHLPSGTDLGCRNIEISDKSSLSRFATQPKQIATTVGLDNDSEDEANARLIAAAPDLLKWAENLLGVINHIGILTPARRQGKTSFKVAWKNLEEAITKAKRGS